MNDTEATKKGLSISGEYHGVPVHTYTHVQQTHSLSSKALDCPVPHTDILLLRLLPDITMRGKTKAKGGMVSQASDSALSDMLTRVHLDAEDK